MAIVWQLTSIWMLQKKRNNYTEDIIVVAESVDKASRFVHNTSIKYWDEIEQLELEKEIDAKIKRDFIPKSITTATETTAQVLG